MALIDLHRKATSTLIDANLNNSQLYLLRSIYLEQHHFGHGADFNTLQTLYPTKVLRIKAAREGVSQENGEGSIHKFRKWAQQNRWDKFGPAANHYDWWMFPQKYISKSSQTSKFYAVTDQDIQELKSDSSFVKDYLDGVKLMAKSWGWDIETGTRINNPSNDQKWKGHNIRLIKVATSLKQFGYMNLYNNLVPFATQYGINI